MLHFYTNWKHQRFSGAWKWNIELKWIKQPLNVNNKNTGQNDYVVGVPLFRFWKCNTFKESIEEVLKNWRGLLTLLLIIYPFSIYNSVFTHRIHSHYLLYYFVLKKQIQIFFSYFSIAYYNRYFEWFPTLQKKPFLQCRTTQYPNNFSNNFLETIFWN